MNAWSRFRQVGVCLAALTLCFSTAGVAAASPSPLHEQEPQLSRILREATQPSRKVEMQTQQLVRGITQHANGLRARHVSYPANGTVLIHTPAVHQYPELKDGCEVTALAMLLQSLGHSGDKMQLAREVRKDPTPVHFRADKSISYWGNPNTGFVGAVNGRPIGYGVFHGPIRDLLNQHLPGQAVDLTGYSFGQVLQKVSEGKPVVVWTTTRLRPSNLWTSWNTPRGRVNITWEEHAVLVVGYGPGVVYINDPFDGTAAKRVNRAAFEASWVQLGRQAVSIR